MPSTGSSAGRPDAPTSGSSDLASPEGSEPQRASPEGSEPQRPSPEGSEPQRANPEGPRAAARRALFAGLARIYDELDAELARLGPRCERSGVCCDFERAGHTLFASSVEAAYLREHVALAGREVTAEVCPLMADGLCSVRDHRALGCRVYFCDPAFAGDMPAVHERFYERIKSLWDEHGAAAGIEWAYRPWLDWIGEVAGDRRPARGARREV